MELLSCEGSVDTQIFYKWKNKYFDLIKEYLGEIINPNVFRTQFTIMTRENMREADQILNDLE